VLFVVKAGRFSKEIVEFFNKIQVKVLERKCIKNSILVVTKEENWVAKQKNDQSLKIALDNCNQLYKEFNLRFDYEEEDDDYKRSNAKHRQKAINNLVDFINEQSFRKVDLKFMEKKIKEEIERENELKKIVNKQPTPIAPPQPRPGI
jgi:hypothetical protein